jgi:CheY-like chemotaxis protein
LDTMIDGEPGFMKQILVIDDDQDIRESLAAVLESEGMQPRVAADGQKGLDYLREAKQLPDVILLDLTMPVMDGFQFRAIQVADEYLRQIPVIVMTARPGVDIKNLAVAGFIRKPFAVDLLLSLILKLTGS